MHSEPVTRQRLNPAAFFAGLVLFAVVYHNLTPFISIDCWWHMRFAKYFIEMGHPVLYDPFAVQGEKILATYPDLLPGLLMLWTYKIGSILGLNILRIFTFSIFILILLLLARRAWEGYVVLLQIAILAVSMDGRVILQPDLFNYPLFALWIFLLDGFIFKRAHSCLRFCGLLLIEQLWINTHPTFFYYGLLTMWVTFAWALLGRWRNWSGAHDQAISIGKLSIYVFCISFAWSINPLGWRAFESLFINMIDTKVELMSMQSPFAWFKSINMFSYLVIIFLFLMTRPWRNGLSRLQNYIMATMLVILFIPSFLYERSLPFLCIYMIVIEGKCLTASYLKLTYLRSACMVLAVLVSVFLIGYRNFPDAIGKASTSIGMSMHGSKFPGPDVTAVHRAEAIREVNILNQVAPPGNCVVSHMPMASCAVWFCPDKPFYVYGHASIINRRWGELTSFLSNLGSTDSMSFVEKNDIRTLVLWDFTEKYFKVSEILNRHWQLVYIDPIMTVLVRKDAMTDEEDRRLRDFYGNFRAGISDAQRFGYNDQIYQYFLLWFSAEATGNDGSYYLNVARDYIDPQKLSATMSNMAGLIRALRAERAAGRTLPTEETTPPQ